MAKINKFTGLMLMLLLLGALVAGIVLVSQRQEIRKKAAVPESNVALILSPATSVQVGNILPVTVAFQSTNLVQENGLVGLAATLSYTFTGDNPLTLTPADIENKLDTNWRLLKKEVTTQNNTTTIRLAAAYFVGGPNGDLTAENTPKDWVVLNFHATRAASVNVQFNRDESAAMTKKSSLNALALMLTGQTYTLTDTPVPTTTLTPTPTPTLTPTPTATGTPVPTPTVDPNTISLNFSVKFQGVESKKADQKIKLMVKKIGLADRGFPNITVTANDAGIYSGQVVLTGVTAGDNYTLFIKGPKHLARKFCINNQAIRCVGNGQITLNIGTNTLDLSKIVLEAGDLPNPDGGQDGKATVADLSLVRRRVTQAPTAADLAIADVNLDGNISAIDVRLIRDTLETKYEEEY